MHLPQKNVKQNLLQRGGFCPLFRICVFFSLLTTFALEDTVSKLLHLYECCTYPVKALEQSMLLILCNGGSKSDECVPAVLQNVLGVVHGDE